MLIKSQNNYPKHSYQYVCRDLALHKRGKELRKGFILQFSL